MESHLVSEGEVRIFQRGLRERECVYGALELVLGNKHKGLAIGSSDKFFKSSEVHFRQVWSNHIKERLMMMLPVGFE